MKRVLTSVIDDEGSHQLPDEIVHLILSRFHVRQLFMCARVCKQWYTAMPKAVTTLRGPDLLQGCLINRLPELINLTSLDIRETYALWDRDIYSLLHLTRLRSLYALNTVTQSMTWILAYTTNLTSLSLEYTGRATLDIIRAQAPIMAPSLRTLRLNNIYHPIGPGVISCLTNLTTLSLITSGGTACGDPTNGCLCIPESDFESLTKLVSLTLNDCPCMCALHIGTRVRCKLAHQLEYLDLYRNTAKLMGPALFALTNLQTLVLRNPHMHDMFNERREIVSFPALTSLSHGRGNTWDGEFASFPYTQMQSCSVYSLECNAAQHTTRMSSLTELNVDNVDGDISGLAHFTALRTLRIASPIDCDVYVPLLTTLVSLPNLTALHLNELQCGLPSHFLDGLTRLTNLSRVSMSIRTGNDESSVDEGDDGDDEYTLPPPSQLNALPYYICINRYADHEMTCYPDGYRY